MTLAESANRWDTGVVEESRHMVTNRLAPPHAIDRPALRERLDEGLARPLSVVVAEAGAGKTVLVSQWLAEHPEFHSVWLDIAAIDNDPVRFFHRMLDGLAAIDPGLADLDGLVAAKRADTGVVFVDELADGMAGLPPTVIVFDDLHTLSNRRVLAELLALVDRMPDQVHLVFSSRVDLPIGWGRRLGRFVTEIRSADLAFDGPETSELLRQISGRELSASNVDVLVRRTEGWAAGLQLAGMTLKTHDDPDRFIAQFDGTDRLVADYLGEEVLHEQSRARRALLLKLSVVDELNAELVSWLTGEPNPQLLLEELERESMFLVALDSHREWFRFHQLFRELLRYRLRAEQPGAEAVLLARAASWYREHGELSPAVEYLLRAKEWDAALDVIRARGSEIFERGEVLTVMRWIAELPSSPTSSAASDIDLVEPLTHRELEILSYLPSRFTNTELAERCFVSVNTIKTHVVHIYRKLGVPNRNAAIERARELGLLH